MFMTEEEARENTCCKQTYSSQKEGQMLAVSCLGSMCMAWRWDVRGMQVNDEGQHLDVRTRRGYCGLAGEPSRYDIAQDELDEAWQGEEP